MLMSDKHNMNNEFENWKIAINQELENTRSESTIFRKDHDIMLENTINANKNLENKLLMSTNQLSEISFS